MKCKYALRTVALLALYLLTLPMQAGKPQQKVNESLPSVKSLKPLKSTIRCRYYGKDFVSVYITSHSSPIAIWQKMIIEIGGAALSDSEAV